MDNKFLILGAKNGLAAFVKMLLKDGYADPAGCDSEALKLAAENGHVATVKILLEDGRADPEAVCMDFVHSSEIAELIKNEITRREALV